MNWAIVVVHGLEFSHLHRNRRWLFYFLGERILQGAGHGGKDLKDGGQMLRRVEACWLGVNWWEVT